MLAWALAIAKIQLILHRNIFNKHIMIQRLQTVYLFAIIALAIIISTGEVLSGLVSSEGVVKVYSLSLIYFKVYENGILVSSEIQYLLILIVSLIIGWTLNVVMNYKNRIKQIKLAKINFVFLIMLLLAIFAKAILSIPEFEFASQNMKSTFAIALILFMCYLNFRAIMLIKHDENLVKSADRLR
jgi:hypothetical protein